VSERPLRLAIAALGGQGGGVLTDWLIEIAESADYIVQATSVPGVAQRTGSTIYYLELLPCAAAARAGREPVMALMPSVADVDCVVASELAEAGRMIQRGLVDPERCTLIASSHRAYTIGEKSAMGRGAADEAQLIALVRSRAKRLILFDMAQVAEQHKSVISAVLLGAICGSGVLPFGKSAFEVSIQHSGIAVETNMAAFREAYERAARGENEPPDRDAGPGLPPPPAAARSPSVQPLLERLRRLPAPLQPLVLEGVRRLIDYQDPAYAMLYLQRVERIAALDAQRSGQDIPAGAGPDAAHLPAGTLTETVARALALWMSFEDPLRVADLKTRAERLSRVRSEVRAAPGQILGITEFVRPRVAEIAATLPAGLGRRLLESPRACRWLARWTGGKEIRTTTLSGFLLLHTLAGFKRWRRGTLRYHEENARIEQWLGLIGRLAISRYGLAVEVGRAQALIKGYGDTYERGYRNFQLLMSQLGALTARADGPDALARLHAAALADEEGAALKRELAAVVPPAAATLSTTSP
jgi:indolepyruvate ferredoxin oxidoreductase beta subunit